MVIKLGKNSEDKCKRMELTCTICGAIFRPVYDSLDALELNGFKFDKHMQNHNDGDD